MVTALTQPVSQQPRLSFGWTVNDKASSVRFEVAQLNLIGRPFRKIEGSFKEYNGIIETATNNFTDAAISFFIAADSLDTGNGRRDKHLASPAFLSTAQYPVMGFQSISFRKLNTGQYILEGDLTIRGVTKRMLFEVSYEGLKKDASGNSLASFKVSAQINRHDFGMKSNFLFEAFIDKMIKIALDLEFSQAT